MLDFEVRKKNCTHFTGYLGDKIGYNTVLVVNLIIAALTQTAFDWTPRFYEQHRIPTLSVLKNETFQMDEIIEFVWPLQCNNTNITIQDCKADSEALIDNSFWLNINEYMCNGNDSVINIDTEPYFECKFLYFKL